MGAAAVVCLFLALLDFGWGQGPPTLAPPFDPDCGDKLNNCALFGSDSCGGQYEDWAKDNCNWTCGYCSGPPTSPLPCVDVLQNCASYDRNACTDPLFVGWAHDNCRYTCQLCTGVSYTTPTISPDKCDAGDQVDCRLYTAASCTGDFADWAKDNCPVFCGFCPNKVTTEPPCIDKRPDCSHYEADMCTNADYRVWVEDNCRNFCNFCGNSVSGAAAATTAGVTPPALTPPPLTTKPPILTPPPFLTPPPLQGRK